MGCREALCRSEHTGPQRAANPASPQSNSTYPTNLAESRICHRDAQATTTRPEDGASNAITRRCLHGESNAPLTPSAESAGVIEGQIAALRPYNA